MAFPFRERLYACTLELKYIFFFAVTSINEQFRTKREQ